MDDASLQVNLGFVDSFGGQLSFTFVLRDNGDGYLQIYGSDPDDLRKSGVLVMLDKAGYEKLKQLIDKTDKTIEKLQSSGQMKRMLRPFG